MLYNTSIFRSLWFAVNCCLVEPVVG